MLLLIFAISASHGGKDVITAAINGRACMGMAATTVITALENGYPMYCF